MLTRKGVFAVFLGLAWATAGHAATSDLPMDKAENDVDNIASLQRGARNFMNYCSGCHSAKYVRWKTIGEGTGSDRGPAGRRS
ncbi:MAG: cytochrome c1 [Woeseiaceae bacterium]|nr:cytochrome c1 [Woeseiaceae bacterium]